jgi:diguanylate cyclase (GGDEF)-like protein/PAS domain S-box-containing protein
MPLRRGIQMPNDETPPIAGHRPDGPGIDDAEGRLRLSQFLLDHAGEAAFWAHTDGRFFYANEEACSSLGYSREELEALSVPDIVPPELAGLFEEMAARVRVEGRVTFETVEVAKDGSTFPVEVRMNYLEHQGREYYCAFVRDIGERKRVERALQESEERYHGLFEGVPVGLYRTTPAGVMLDANSALVKTLGYPSLAALLKANVADIYCDPEDRLRWQRAMAGGGGPIQSYEARVRRYDGAAIWVRFTVRAVRADGGTGGGDGEVLRYDGALEDITDRKGFEEKLLHDALHDDLSGLPNRALFMDRLRQSMERSRREPDRLTAVLFLDLDNFKIVNDSLGHLVGDELLIQISGTLAAALRPSDTIARVGGDEFAILLEGGRDVSDAVRVADRIHDRLSTPINLGGHEVFITASIGIAVHTPEYERPEDLLRDADTAMYRAKSSGRACHVVFNRAMHRFVMARLQLETDLRRAVERGQLRVHYQPFVDLASDEVAGFEALVRWHHPRRGLLLPDEFLGVAEETGLIVPIGRYVLLEGCRQIRELQRKHPERGSLKLSVNLSNKQFFQADLFDMVAEALETSGLDPACLGLEITEGVIINQADSASGRFSRLKSLGVQLYLDDFGKGYSSLNYLHRFPMDILKIDRSFVSRIEETEGNLAIVRAIVTLAHQLGMEVVAEGIQTPEQRARVRALGCEYGQGFYLSHAVPADQAEQLLMRRVKTLAP